MPGSSQELVVVGQGPDRVPLVGVLATRARVEPPSTGEGLERADAIRPDG